MIVLLANYYLTDQIEETKNTVCVAYRGEKKGIHAYGRES